jgi:hypothetical protein
MIYEMAEVVKTTFVADFRYAGWAFQLIILDA